MSAQLDLISGSSVNKALKLNFSKNHSGNRFKLFNGVKHNGRVAAFGPGDPGSNP